MRKILLFMFLIPNFQGHYYIYNTITASNKNKGISLFKAEAF